MVSVNPEPILIDEDRLAENRVSSTEYLNAPHTSPPHQSYNSKRDTTNKSLNRSETWSDVESNFSINDDAEVQSSNNTKLLTPNTGQ